MSEAAAQQVRVVYLAGDGRSGTTVLSRILGSYDDAIAVGELYDIWAKLHDGTAVCSCGSPLSACGFWSAVLREAYGDDSRVTPEAMLVLRASVQGLRHVPCIFFPRIRPAGYRRRLARYVDLTERLYRAISDVSGCSTIVDSSKLAAYALVLRQSPRLDVRFVHVVRDSRACAYSWDRLKPEATTSNRANYLPRRALMRTSAVWNARNTIAAWISKRFAFAATIRYEQFVQAPRQSVSALLGQIGIDGSTAPWVGEHEIREAEGNHLFAGNPDRMERGSIVIRADNRWRQQMPWPQQLAVQVCTFPTLWLLGYIRRGSRSEVRGEQPVSDWRTDP